MKGFAEQLIQWQKQHGRHNLPWQQGIHAYSVWVSEIMLQQTQVVTVIDYYQRFMQRFPTIFELAHADEEAVFKQWAGLGYYQRARNLHKTSQIIAETYHGEFPLDPDQLIALPGIGKSTAHAICSIVGDLPYPILDANAKRVIMRYHNITEDPGRSTIKNALWDLADQLVPSTECRAYTQGLMDLGAQICTSKPHCNICPFESSCQAHQHGKPELIPLKRKKPKKPERSCHLVWYRYNDTFLMLKRPDRGIWSSLWCPVEYASEPTIPQDATRTELPLLKHVFTHFILHISPSIVDLKRPLEGHDGHWFAVHDLQNIAVPAAIKKIQAQHITH